jgi:hypothetical protein
VVRDSSRQVEYVVLAYRQLTKSEVLQAIAHAQGGKKAPKRNSRVRIVTTFGFEDSGGLRRG